MLDILLINNVLYVFCLCNYEKYILLFYFYDVNIVCEMISVYIWIGIFCIFIWIKFWNWLILLKCK